MTKITHVHRATFHASLLAAGRSPSTAAAYDGDVKKFLDWSPPLDADMYGTNATQFINELRTTHAASTGSILRYMSALRVFRQYLNDIGMAATEPFVNYIGPKPYRAQAHPLPGLMVDVDAMVKAAWRPHHKVLIGLCGYAGLRVSEARSITPRSIITDHNGNAWLAVHGKGGAYREVPVADELWTLLETHAPLRPDDFYVPIHDRAARRAITQVAKRAGVNRDVSSHDLRHTFGTEVYSKTKDLRVTQELLGHSSSRTTEGYTGVSEESKRMAVLAALAAPAPVI